MRRFGCSGQQAVCEAGDGWSVGRGEDFDLGSSGRLSDHVSEAREGGGADVEVSFGSQEYFDLLAGGGELFGDLRR